MIDLSYEIARIRAQEMRQEGARRRLIRSRKQAASQESVRESERPDRTAG